MGRIGDIEHDGSVLMVSADGAPVWVPVPTDMTHVVASVLRTVVWLFTHRPSLKRTRGDTTRTISEYNRFVGERLREVYHRRPDMTPQERMRAVCHDWREHKQKSAINACRT
jgi:hypothetical protein